MVGGTKRPGGVEALLKLGDRAEFKPRGPDEAFWVIGAGDHRLVYASPAYAELSGRSQATLHEEPDSWLVSIHPEDRRRVLEALSASQEIGAYEESYRRLGADGEVRWYADRGFLVRHPETGRRLIAGTSRLTVAPR